jgi:hypothetical protein
LLVPRTHSAALPPCVTAPSVSTTEGSERPVCVLRKWPQTIRLAGSQDKHHCYATYLQIINVDSLPIRESAAQLVLAQPRNMRNAVGGTTDRHLHNERE